MCDGSLPFSVSESKMEQMTFHFDTVLSDVHMHFHSAQHLMTRLNQVGQPVFMSRFQILSDGDAKPEPGADVGEAEGGACGGPQGPEEPVLDEDGDLEITRRPQEPSADDGGRQLVCPVILTQSHSALEPEEEDEEEEPSPTDKHIIRIEHTMATTLEDVGKQVWRGALLLADFILSQPIMFRAATVLDMGAGTGLTSIVMATTAKTVYCTDVGEDLLSMCRKNVSLNQHLMEGGEVKVRHLDWLQQSLVTDADLEFSWTEDEVADLHDNTSFIIAADVCYDDDLTDGFFRTLYKLCSSFTHTCIIYISIEKRMNFTLRHMDVSCDAYNHFRHCLSGLQELEDQRCSFTVEQISANFTQFFIYERIEHLELWRVTASPLTSEKELLTHSALSDHKSTVSNTNQDDE
ncbi:methyltransferase-like protein 22 [Gouania willdenowi]|uniref:methyltransferase-like protein 22 n=1 Tax=Gouania willdenowi TaxID=441366 RepID=UPI00105521F0|nr:methyltransferase-like protein 22 [Gouania willdenowi]